MRKKRAQLTIFVIVGILILILSGIFIYVRTRSSETEIERETASAQQAAFDVQPVTSYMDNCLQDISKEALEKIGRQGGVLYTGDGGTTLRTTGPVFLYDSGAFADYDSSTDKLYARYNVWDTPFFQSFYALELEDLSEDLENYVSQRFSFPAAYQSADKGKYNSECVFQLEDGTIFRQEGFEITLPDADDVQVEVSLSDASSTFLLTYPLVIKDLATQEETIVNTYSAVASVRLKKMYEAGGSYVTKLLNGNDADDTLPGPSEGIEFQVVEDFKDNDDLIRIVDKRNLLDSEEYTFQFLSRKEIPNAP